MNLVRKVPYQIGVIQVVHSLNLFEEIIKDTGLSEGVLLQYFDGDGQ